MRRWVALTDVIAITTASLVAHWLRFGFLPYSGYLVWVAMIASVMVATFGLLGLYGRRPAAPGAELGQVMLVTTLSILAFVVLAILTDVYISRSWLLLTWLTATVLVFVSRTAWRYAATRPAAR